MNFEINKKEGVETIKNAAVQYKDMLFEGATHGHAFGELLEYVKNNEPDVYRIVGGGMSMG